MNKAAAAYDGGSLTDWVRSGLSENQEDARAYLRETWLASAVRALWEARRRAGLTQARVADQMHTTQSAIARLENDQEGGISLRRYVDYALACGALPFVPELVSFESLRAYAVDNPDEPLTASAYRYWIAGPPDAGQQQAASIVLETPAGPSALSWRTTDWGGVWETCPYAVSLQEALVAGGGTQVYPRSISVPVVSGAPRQGHQGDPSYLQRQAA
jgi:transcriptional regulator with XRE-family HTH domain